MKTFKVSFQMESELSGLFPPQSTAELKLGTWVPRTVETEMHVELINPALGQYTERQRVQLALLRAIRHAFAPHAAVRALPEGDTCVELRDETYDYVTRRCTCGAECNVVIVVGRVVRSSVKVVSA